MADTVNVNKFVHDISVQMDVEISEVHGPMDGRSNQIYQLKSSKGELWSLRIPKSADAASLSKRGIPILRHLAKMQPTLQVPRPIYESEQYSLLSFLQGDRLGYWDSTKLTVQRRHQLLDSLARFLLELWTVAAPQSEACSLSYDDWLLDEIDMGFRRSLPENSGWGDPVSFLRRRASRGAVVPDRNCNQLAIKHGDLSAWNIVVDDEGVSGVIDWDTAGYVPLPAAVHHPLFIADIPGWCNGIPEGMTFEEDRAYLEAEVQKLAAQRGDANSLWIADLLRTSLERQFLELSLRNKRINNCYIDMRGMKASVDGDVVREQLEQVLLLHPELREHPGVATLFLRLDGGGCVLPE